MHGSVAPLPEIIASLQRNTDPLRLLLQASAGTGKSFLLETVYIWCVLNGHVVESCAPTGIAATRLRVRRTPAQAYTIHHLFALNVELESKLDPSKKDDEKTVRLSRTTVLIIDEASMVDDPCWAAIKDQLTTVGALGLNTPGKLPHPKSDDYGSVHLILALDLKQLPPATSQAPFVAADPHLLDTFAFRVLRQNRRLIMGTDSFHDTLEDIAAGTVSDKVRQYLVDSYVRGARMTQDNVEFEGSTACFTKRRYRDRWNKRVLARIGEKYKRSLRVKAVFVARGARNAFVRDAAAEAIRRTVRSQSLVSLRLAGQWLEDPPLGRETRPHCMRAMLVANVDVPNRFANGACGRVVHWGPDTTSGTSRQKSVLANVPGLQARFFHESSMQENKSHFLPQVDFLDIEPRREMVPSAVGKPIMLQFTLQPAYGLSIHKVQSLTIVHKVLGCLEGVFAHGQIYVLISRVTDPKNFHAVGLPPADLLDAVAEAVPRESHMKLFGLKTRKID